MTPSRIRKQYIIATALIAGIRIAHVARQIGVSRSWASREANSAGVRNIVADMLLKHREEIERLFFQCLYSIREALQARRVYRHRGRIVEGGPDHEVRLEAVSTFINLMEALEIYREIVVNAAYRSAGRPV